MTAPELRQDRPDLDNRILLETSEGDLEFERELLETFFACQEDTMSELKSATDRSDLNWIERAAHQATGSASAVGAAKLAELTALLERAAHRGDFAGAVRLQSEILEAYSRLKAIAARHRSI